MPGLAARNHRLTGGRIKTLTPVGGQLDVTTGSRLVDGLLARVLQVDMACGGRGVCATCHVYVRAGQGSVSPPTAREERTIALVTPAEPDSRLACQSRIEGEGIVVEIPEGLCVQSAEQPEKQVGTTAKHDYLHPITCRRLIPKGKLTTRSVFTEFIAAATELRKVRETAG